MTNAWQERAPILKRLPSESQQYQGNSVVEALVAPWDELLISTKGRIDNFYQDFLNPLTAKPEHLDWLSGLCGYTSEYSLVEYPEAIKRQLIARAFDYVWINKGSRGLLEYLIIQSFQVDAEIYLLGNFIADVSVVGDPLGGEAFEYYIRLPLKYLRTSKTWQLTERLNRLYGPIYCHSQILYDRFYAGFSAAGELVFSDSSYKFVPFTTNLIAWLLSTNDVEASNSSVQKWGGFYQDSVDFQPTLISEIDYPALRFDGNDSLNLQFNELSEITFFAVVNSGSDNGVLAQFDTDTAEYSFFYDSQLAGVGVAIASTSSQIDYYAVADDHIYGSSYVVYTGVLREGSALIFLNSELIFETPLPQGSILFNPALIFDAGALINSNSFDGNIKEIFIYNQFLTQLQRLEFENYLKKKYNI